MTAQRMGIGNKHHCRHPGLHGDATAIHALTSRLAN